MSKEDELVNAIIEYERGIETFDTTVEPEAHYNHYSKRGVVDLYVQREPKDGPRQDIVIEAKSDAAVQNATGANEIIRQFNRMRDGFYEDESRDRARYVNMQLVFTITPAAVYHVAENLSMYTAADQSKVLQDGMRSKSQSSVVFRSRRKNELSGIALVDTDGNSVDDLESWVEYIDEKREGEGGPASRMLAILENRYGPLRSD